MAHLLVYKYVRMALQDIPQEKSDQYNLTALVSNGWVYMEIRKGIPGLKKAGKVGNIRLTGHLATHGYTAVPRTPALWRHTFTFVVNDFGEKNTKHLIRALRELYEISIDWKGGFYIRLTLRWKYIERLVIILMQNYIAQILHRFQHQPTP